MTPERKTELAQDWKACGDGWCVLGMPLLGGCRLYSLADECGWMEVDGGGWLEEVHASEVLPDPTAPGNLGIIQAQVRELSGDPGARSENYLRARDKHFVWKVRFRSVAWGHSQWAETEFEAWLAALRWLTKGREQ